MELVLILGIVLTATAFWSASTCRFLPRILQRPKKFVCTRLRVRLWS